MKRVCSSLPHTKTNGTSSSVGQGEPEETSRSRLQALRESDHCWQIVDSPLRFQTQTWKRDVAAKRGEKTSAISATEISGEGPIGGVFRLYGDNLLTQLPFSAIQTILRQLLVHMRRKHPKLVNNWIFHQDNAPLYKTHCVTEFLDEHNIKVMEHSPNHLDLVPCDFWFRALKKAWRGWHFHSDRELLTATRTSFNCSLESQFSKINGQNMCRNAFWTEVTILRKIEAKMKMLVVIANKIFYHFSFENWDWCRWSKLYTTSCISNVIHHREVFILNQSTQVCTL